MNTVAEALRRPEAYPHPTDQPVRVVETHISLIFLTGTYAYKLKKPVNLGFLDFSSIEKRKKFCHEELRLNRRLCPDLYLGVLPVVLCDERFRIGGEGTVADYVVKMLQFDPRRELDRLLASGGLSEAMIDELGDIVASFHTSLPPADFSSPFGTPERLLEPVIENLDCTRQLPAGELESESLDSVRLWSMQEHRRLGHLFMQRKRDGFVRQCHGDMHTGNMVVWKGRIHIFDCIEFNQNLSVIDVVSDMAFLFMDLQHSGRQRLAWRFLNIWLSLSGDYEGLRLLKFYCTYRAMVRAKVTAIRCSQECETHRRNEVLKEHRSYLSLALGYTRPAFPVLVITHGVSGSGKTRLSADIAQLAGCIHIRSDIERKRLYGLGARERSLDAGIGIYSAEATQKTYAILLEAAAAALSGGYTIIADATFLSARIRGEFIRMAEGMQCRARILDVHAPEPLLRERVCLRHKEGHDASEADTAVLEAQLKRIEPPTLDERPLCITVDTSAPVDHAALIAAIFSSSPGGAASR